jgi:hypothetical protein
MYAFQNFFGRVQVFEEIKGTAAGLLKPLNSEIGKGIDSMRQAFTKAMGAWRRNCVQVSGLWNGYIVGVSD